MARTTLTAANLAATPQQASALPTLYQQLSNLVNEHAAALDALIAVGSLVPAINYADGTLTGTDPPMITIVVPDHATQDVDFVIPFKCEIVDVAVKKITAAATAVANSFQLQTGAGAAITNAISINNSARGDIVRATNIDDTGTAIIAAGGTLRVHQVKAGGDASGRLQVTVIPRA